MHATALILAGLLLSGLMLKTAQAATSLFDPERGAQTDAGGQSSANKSGTLYELRLDGVLTVGNHHHVVISGAEGEVYHFRWEGPIFAPLAFKEDSTEKLTGFGLSSIETRSVWLRLPSGTSCEPDPERGLVACDKGRAKLALIARNFPPGAATPPANQLQPSPEQNVPAHARARQQMPPSNTQQASSGTSPGNTNRRTRTAVQSTLSARNSERLKGNTAPSSNPRSTTSSQSQSAQNSSPQFANDTPARAELRAKQQQLIDSAPPGYFGVE
ncbi:MAG: hypothetical protein KDI68_09315 [Gammaproteobacteria bacterium]|nr:hypothetical protein [Gammaproteobacteria bacterium]